MVEHVERLRINIEAARRGALNIVDHRRAGSRASAGRHTTQREIFHPFCAEAVLAGKVSGVFLDCNRLKLAQFRPASDRSPDADRPAMR